MIVELGHFALWLAFWSSMALVVCAGGSFVGRVSPSQRAVVPLMTLMGLFVACAFVVLAAAFLQDDFSVALVASHSHVGLPIQYKFGAVWGNHEGSLLMWILVLCGWGVLFSRSSLPADFMIRSLGVLGLLLAALLGFSLFTSNPFVRLLPLPPGAGAELNPLLQDPAMMLHPPLLYLGYVGFAMPFAMAIAALTGRGVPVADWARWTRLWSTAAWAFLTVGIALGSWWAYYELGWGGWWFWDAVENASLMPWLCGIALLHSLRVTERKGQFQAWSILLAISCFALSLLGTFLVRSGLLISVHSFAADPARGLYLLLLLLVVGGVALLLFQRRAPLLGGSPAFPLFSREGALWLNNLLLVTATLTVLCGTLFPLFMQLLGRGVWSVGPPYFNTVILPLALIMLLAMAPAPTLRWGKNTVPAAISLLWFLLAVTAGASLPLIYGEEWQWPAAVGSAAICWLLLHCLAGLRRLPLSVSLAHLGVAVCAMGIGFSSWYGLARDVSLAPGESAGLGRYEFRLLREQPLQGSNYSGEQLQIWVSDELGDTIAVLRPERRFYPTREMHLSETDIAVLPGGDLYVSPSERLEDGRWTLRIQYKPMIRLIWLGGLLMALGGMAAAVSAWTRQRRQRQRR